MIPTALIIITFFVLQSYAISYCIMMESTRQQWRVYAIATIALIVIILLSTQVSLRFQVHNKARYTAISCRRVDRGGNTRFLTFQLERDRPTNQPTDRPTDGRTKPLIELRVRN